MPSIFPLYSKEVCMYRAPDGEFFETDETLYMKRISVNQMMTISVEGTHGVTWFRCWCNTGMVSECLSGDHNLGLGRYHCTEEEFNSVMARAQVFLKDFAIFPRDSVMLWVVGKVTDYGAKEWELIGVFDDHEVAVQACSSPFYFLGPTEMNKALPDETVEWVGAYYPLTAP